MSTEATRDELAQAKARLQALAAEHPTAVLMAMLEQLVEVACGSNLALRDVMRLQFYRGMLRKAGIQWSGSTSSDPAPAAARQWSPVQPIGFRCPKCGAERQNPEAVHQPRELRSLVNSLEPRLCENCRPEPAVGPSPLMR